MAEAGRCGIRSSERAREKAWSESASTEELSQPKKIPGEILKPARRRQSYCPPGSWRFAKRCG